MVRRALIDFNPVDLQYYSFMVSLDAFSGSCKSGNDLSISISVTSKTRDMNVRAFNMIANRNEVKALVKHISYDRKCKSNISTCNSNQK